MKIVHVPFTSKPDPVGGTEVYVESMARMMSASGVQSVVAAPGRESASYTVNGLPVRRFAVSADLDLRALYGEGDPGAAAGFGRILDKESPDLVHLHAFTSGASIRCVMEARKRRIPVLFTYHTPTASCARGTLLRWGGEACDGFLDVPRCARCTLHAHGVNRVAAWILGSLPPSFGTWLGEGGRSGGLWTGLRMSELIQLRHAAFRRLVSEVDHVVVLCHWTRDLLERNGIPAGRVSLIRHGLPYPVGFQRSSAVPERFDAQRPLRVAFMGRLDPVKGAHILIRAIRAIPQAPLELCLFTIRQDEGGEAYAQTVLNLAKDDLRISLREAITAADVPWVLREHDLLAVPSQLLETGPLTILEAFAAGVPVVGSNLGGIAERVRHEVDGLLVPFNSVPAWSTALMRLVEEPGLVAKLKKEIQTPCSMEDVAREMMALYEHTIAARATSSR